MMQVDMDSQVNRFTVLQVFLPYRLHVCGWHFGSNCIAFSVSQIFTFGVVAWSHCFCYIVWAFLCGGYGSRPAMHFNLQPVLRGMLRFGKATADRFERCSMPPMLELVLQRRTA